MSKEYMRLLDKRVAAANKEGITFEELQQVYTEWAKSYDYDADIWKYRGPEIAAKEVVAILGSNRNARILDVCTGTGLVGKELHEAGYQNIDGLDGNAAMLEEARKKNVFKNTIQANIGQSLDIPDNSYDVIIVAGTLHHTHIKEEYFPCFREFIRISKPGGYFYGCIAYQQMREDHRNKLEAYFKTLVDEGLWELVANKLIEETKYEDDLQNRKSSEQIWIYRIK